MGTGRSRWLIRDGIPHWSGTIPIIDAVAYLSADNVWQLSHRLRDHGAAACMSVGQRHSKEIHELEISKNKGKWALELLWNEWTKFWTVVPHIAGPWGCSTLLFGGSGIQKKSLKTMKSTKMSIGCFINALKWVHKFRTVVPQVAGPWARGTPHCGGSGIQKKFFKNPKISKHKWKWALDAL